MTTAGRASLGAARTAMPVGAKDMQSTMKDSIGKGRQSVILRCRITTQSSCWGENRGRGLVKAYACHLPATHRANKDVAWRGC